VNCNSPFLIGLADVQLDDPRQAAAVAELLSRVLLLHPHSVSEDSTTLFGPFGLSVSLGPTEAFAYPGLGRAGVVPMPVHVLRSTSASEIPRIVACALMTSAYRTAEHRASTNSWVGQVVYALRRDPLPMTLRGLAQRLGITPRTANRRWRACGGEDLPDLVRKNLLVRAVAERYSDASLAWTDAAARIGLSPSTMRRGIRREAGCSLAQLPVHRFLALVAEVVRAVPRQGHAS